MRDDLSITGFSNNSYSLLPEEGGFSQKKTGFLGEGSVEQIHNKKFRQDIKFTDAIFTTIRKTGRERPIKGRGAFFKQQFHRLNVAIAKSHQKSSQKKAERGMSNCALKSQNIAIKALRSLAFFISVPVVFVFAAYKALCDYGSYEKTISDRTRIWAAEELSALYRQRDEIEDSIQTISGSLKNLSEDGEKITILNKKLKNIDNEIQERQRDLDKACESIHLGNNNNSFFNKEKQVDFHFNLEKRNKDISKCNQSKEEIDDKIKRDEENIKYCNHEITVNMETLKNLKGNTERLEEIGKKKKEKMDSIERKIETITLGFIPAQEEDFSALVEKFALPLTEKIQCMEKEIKNLETSAGGTFDHFNEFLAKELKNKIDTMSSMNQVTDENVQKILEKTQKDWSKFNDIKNQTTEKKLELLEELREIYNEKVNATQYSLEKFCPLSEKTHNIYDNKIGKDELEEIIRDLKEQEIRLIEQRDFFAKQILQIQYEDAIEEKTKIENDKKNILGTIEKLKQKGKNLEDKTYKLGQYMALILKKIEKNKKKQESTLQNNQINESNIMSYTHLININKECKEALDNRKCSLERRNKEEREFWEKAIYGERNREKED